MKAKRIGLVLSGGGGKGAYQVGVARRLAELELPIHAVAGTSVGALNGSVLASAPSLNEGASRLEAIWQRLAAEPPVELKIGAFEHGLVLGFYLTLLFSTGHKPFLLQILKTLIQEVRNNRRAPPTHVNVRKMNDSTSGDVDTVEGIVNRHLDAPALNSGIPFYVGVFRSKGTLIDLGYVALGLSRLGETPDADFLHLQSLTAVDQRAAILASAAIPILLESQTINEITYVDGGLGGWLAAQGNTPATPLITREQCDLLIVVHNSDGSFWDRHRFPNTTVIEIRPETPIRRQGWLDDTITFDADALASWEQQGYEDAKRCLHTVLDAFFVRELSKKADSQRRNVVRALTNEDNK